MLILFGRAHAQFTWPTVRFVEGVGFREIATNIVNWVLVLAGVIAVVYLVYGGILYITAGGDAEKATKGRTAVINAIIGIIIILLAIVIVNWVMRIVQSGTAG